MGSGERERLPLGMLGLSELGVSLMDDHFSFCILIWVGRVRGVMVLGRIESTASGALFDSDLWIEEIDKRGDLRRYLRLLLPASCITHHKTKTVSRLA